MLGRLAPLAVALAGSVLLIVAEFSDLWSIKVITVTVATGSVGSHHGYALLVVAVVAAAMAFGATLGGSRPAAVAITALGAAALLIALLVDLPVVDDTGVYGRNYERAQAQAETGFYLETLGAVLVLLAGAAMLAFGPRREPRSRRVPASA